MNAPIRTVLILGILALVGLSALGWLAQRYRSMVPESAEVSSEPTGAAPAAPAGPPDPALDSPEVASPEVASAEPPAPFPPSPEALALVDRFLEVRSAVREALDKYPYSKKVLAAEIEDEKTPFEKVPMSMDAMAEIRIRRGVALERSGLSAADYDRVRTAWTRLRDGKGAIDPDLRRALEAKRGALDAVDLGRLEELDYKLAF